MQANQQHFVTFFYIIPFFDISEPFAVANASWQEALATAKGFLIDYQ
jgi:hypothetical protein